MDKSRSDVLRDILSLAKSELNKHESIGYTMPDGKYHIYVYVDKSVRHIKDGVTPDDFYYVIEPNRVIDGAMEPMGDTATADYNDFAELLVGCSWCLEEFERDLEREKEIVVAEASKELLYVSNTMDFKILKSHLNIDSLRLIDNIYRDYAKDRIDLDVPRDENGNFNFEDVKLLIKDISYEETGCEKLVLKWLEDMEDTGYLIECFEDIQENLKTFEYVVDYVFNGKRHSFEFSCVGENHPTTQWLADQIFAKLSEKYAGVDYRAAVNSIDCIGMQVTQNGEYVSGDELVGEELNNILEKVIGFVANRQVSIDEQISSAQEFIESGTVLKNNKNIEFYK